MLEQVAVLLAGFLTAITGFGFNALSLPLLVLAFEPHHAVVVGLLIGLLIFGLVLLLPGVRQSIDKPMVLTLFAWSLPGLPLGALLLVWLDARALQLLVGGLTFAYATGQLLGRLPAIPATRRAAPFVGVLSGVLASSVSLGGTPVMPYLLGSDKATPSSLRATAVGYVLLSTVASLVVPYWTGLVDRSAALLDAARLVPAAPVGFSLGALTFRFIGPVLFVRMTLIVLATVGLIALTAAIR